MKDFFKVVDIQTVYGYLETFAPVDTETVSTTLATGRVLSRTPLKSENWSPCSFSTRRRNEQSTQRDGCAAAGAR